MLFVLSTSHKFITIRILARPTLRSKYLPCWDICEFPVLEYSHLSRRVKLMALEGSVISCLSAAIDDEGSHRPCLGLRCTCTRFRAAYGGTLLYTEGLLVHDVIPLLA